MGEAAGIAASMAVKNNNRMKDTDIPLLREKLRAQRAKID